MNFLVPYLMRWNSLNRSRYYQLFCQLAQKGHVVHILQPPLIPGSADTGFISARETAPPPGIFVHDVSVYPPFWNTPLPFNKIIKKSYYCFLINQQIHHWIKDLSIDVLLFYNLALYPLSQVDTRFTIYDLGDDHIELLKAELGRMATPWIIKPVHTRMCKMIQSCRMVTTVSKDLEKKYPAPSYLLPNGINMDEVHPGEGAQIRALYKKPIVGFIGSLEYFIDFDLLLKTASRMPEITFLIAGGGREEARIQAIKNRERLSNVYLTGGRPHAEILRFIDAMDIGLNLFIKSPLTHAACPIKLFEYLAYKKPVISSRIRQVQNMDEGFLYYADTPEELEQVITAIFNNPQEAVRKSEQGYEVVKAKYTWDKIAGDFLAAIDKERERASPAKRNPFS